MAQNNSNKNVLIAALVAIAVALGGYVIYQQQTKPDLSISVSEDGIDVDTN